MSKYAPANENGEKPYFVEIVRWGRSSSMVVYAENTSDARYRALGRHGPGEYVQRVRRARSGEVDNTKPEESRKEV